MSILFATIFLPRFPSSLSLSFSIAFCFPQFSLFLLLFTIFTFSLLLPILPKSYSTSSFLLFLFNLSFHILSFSLAFYFSFSLLFTISYLFIYFFPFYSNLILYFLSFPSFISLSFLSFSHDLYFLPFSLLFLDFLLSSPNRTLTIPISKTPE